MPVELLSAISRFVIQPGLVDVNLITEQLLRSSRQARIDRQLPEQVAERMYVKNRTNIVGAALPDYPVG
jgi:hypothetical protein